jgi:nucleoside-diphosphate-sugar epimerase
LIIRIMNKDPGVVYKEARVGDIKHSLADISKAKLFDYQPLYALERGLRESIDKLK